MKTNTRSNNITLTVMFFAMVFGCLCLLVPVWQNAENSRMRSRLMIYERNLSEKEEAKMILETQVACKTSPEYLGTQADVININFQQIAPTTALRVASNW